MSNAPNRLTLVLIAGLSLAACQRSASDQNISIDNGVGAKTEIEAVPPDESSATPANELVNGNDNPDVNETNSSTNAN